jgi:hypothetical protein
MSVPGHQHKHHDIRGQIIIDWSKLWGLSLATVINSFTASVTPTPCSESRLSPVFWERDQNFWRAACDQISNQSAYTTSHLSRGCGGACTYFVTYVANVQDRCASRHFPPCDWSVTEVNDMIDIHLFQLRNVDMPGDNCSNLPTDLAWQSAGITDIICSSRHDDVR